MINVASASQQAVAVADSEYGRYTADQAIDGKVTGPNDSPDANRWHSALSKPHPHWIWVRFRERARIEKVVLHRADLKDYPVDFVGEYSPDGGETFFTLFSVTNNQMAADRLSIEKSFKPRVMDNFRLRILKSAHAGEPKTAQISELEVFGEFIGPSSSTAKESPKRSEFLTDPFLTPGPAAGLEISRRPEEVEFRSKWLRIAFSTKTPTIRALCWDSLGEGKVNENFLKTTAVGGIKLNQALVFPEAASAAPGGFEMEQNVVRYSQTAPGGTFTRWEIRVEPKAIRLVIASQASRTGVCREPLGIRFAFDPAVTPVAPLANPRPNVTAPLPLLLHAADYGTLLVRALSDGDSLLLTAEPGIRSAVQWDAIISKLETPRSSDGLFPVTTNAIHSSIDLSVETCAPFKELIQDEPRLHGLARTWLNTFQFRPEMGILANNPLSDNAVLCMFTYTDPAVFTPILPGNVAAINLARESLDQYFAGANGYGVGREDAQNDTYPSLLIAAWDVIRVTGDVELLKRWLPILENLAAKAIAQDHDGNGLPESSRPGVSGDFRGPTGNWWDQINFGYEDAYVCALSFRAFRALADLERLAARPPEAERFEKQADRIRAAYVPNFLNSKTGVIAGWKDSKGELHDYWFIFINGMAITYGLVPEPLANSIIDRFQSKLKEVGYNRFDLGLPGNLIPVRKSDYGLATLGTPQKDDGSDTFGVFENGGASACYAYFYVQALYQMGRRAAAERILWPMVDSFANGRFQNGIGHGGEWRHWDGRPSGYEGFLADSYYAQLAVFTGHYGIGFGPDGFRLENWSPLKGKPVSLGLNYMGRVTKTLE